MADGGEMGVHQHPQSVTNLAELWVVARHAWRGAAARMLASLGRSGTLPGLSVTFYGDHACSLVGNPLLRFVGKLDMATPVVLV